MAAYDVMPAHGGGLRPIVPSNWTTVSNASDPNDLADTKTVVAGGVVFIVILPLVLFNFKCFPLGTMAAILSGALLMVVTTVISQEEVYTVLSETENLRTIFLLSGMMLLSQYFEREKLIDMLLHRCLSGDLSFWCFLLRINAITFISSAVFTNDAACALLTPLFLKFWQDQRRPTNERNTLLLAIATSANIGSVVTVFGNPQMALIASHTDVHQFADSKLDLTGSIKYMGPPALVIFGLNLGFLLLYYRASNYILSRRNNAKELTDLVSSANFPRERDDVRYSMRSADMTQSGEFGRSLISLSTRQKQTKPEEVEDFQPSGSRFFQIFICVMLLLVLVLLFIHTETIKFDIGLVPMGASIIILAVDAAVNKRSASVIISRIDWGLIMMFFGLFVWLEGVNKGGLPRWVWKKIGLTGSSITSFKDIAVFSGFVVIASNIFSNVPVVIIILDQLKEFAKQRSLVAYLAWCSTIAGNLTLFGSVANLIVAQKAHETTGTRLTFWTYLKFGFVSTLVNICVGLPIIHGLLLLY